MAEKFTWEQIKPHGDKLNRPVFRARVPGGWLVRDGAAGFANSEVNTVYVPDPLWSWNVELLPSE